MDEQWISLDFEVGYQISSMGRIRSVDRIISQSSRTAGKTYEREMRGRIMKPVAASGTGYMQIWLNKKRRYSMHRLVAMAFCDGYQEGLEVNHKNGIRSDNRAENLEWVSASANNLHAYSELGRVPSTLGKFAGESPAAKPVIAIGIETGEVIEFHSIADAVTSGFNRHSIWRCCSGRAKSHKGYSWLLASR